MASCLNFSALRAHFSTPYSKILDTPLHTDNCCSVGQKYIGVFFDTMNKLKTRSIWRVKIKGDVSYHLLHMYLDEQRDNTASKEFTDDVHMHTCFPFWKVVNMHANCQAQLWAKFGVSFARSILIQSCTINGPHMYVPLPLKVETSFTLQLLLDWLFKCLINILAMDNKAHCNYTKQEVNLTHR